MALSQLIPQVPGGLIKSGDWNNEFQNILTHPIALISPTTGAINFNLQAHTNLLPATITATGGSAGQALMSTGGATVSFQSVLSTGTPPLAGSTGQVLAITSSSTGPSFQVLPIDGGLSTATPTAGMVYYISSSAAKLLGLAVGSSGQVLMVATSGLPTWQNMTTGGGSGGGLDPENNGWTLYEDFLTFYSTTPSTVNRAVDSPQVFALPWNLNNIQIPTTANSISQPGGIFNFVSSGAAAIGMWYGGSTAAATQISSGPVVDQRVAQGAYTYKTRFRQFSTVATQTIIGLASSGSFNTTSPAQGILLISTAPSATASLFAITSSGASSLSAGVTVSSFHTYDIVVTSSVISLTVDGAAVGTITGNIPSSTPLAVGGGLSAASAGIGISWDYIYITSTFRS